MIEQLKKIEPQRDQLGYWIHPAFYHFYEQIAQGADGLTKTQMEQLEKLIGHKISITEIWNQISDEDATRLEKGDMDVVSEWQPKPPNDKAFLVSIHDTDDSTVAWWATPQTINDKCVGIEKARQEMKRQAFERVFLRKHWVEWSEDKQRYDCVIGLSDPACAEYNKMWDVWQAAQEQVLQNLYQDRKNGFFSYDGCGNYMRHENLLEAKIEAESAVNYFEDQLGDGSFHPDGDGNFQDVGYGVILGTSSYSVDHVVTQDDVDNGEYSYPVGTEILSLNLVDLVRDQPQKTNPNAFLSAIADMGIKIGSGDYVLVPKRPTFKMYQAFQDKNELDAVSGFKNGYKAMLEAANQ